MRRARIHPRQFRPYAPLTLQEAADRLGVARETLWKWRKGIRKPSELARLRAEAVGIVLPPWRKKGPGV